jgi:hypothetical protein
MRPKPTSGKEEIEFNIENFLRISIAKCNYLADFINDLNLMEYITLSQF